MYSFCDLRLTQHHDICTRVHKFDAYRPYHLQLISEDVNNNNDVNDDRYIIIVWDHLSILILPTKVSQHMAIEPFCCVFRLRHLTTVNWGIKMSTFIFALKLFLSIFYLLASFAMHKHIFVGIFSNASYLQTLY